MTAPALAPLLAGAALAAWLALLLRDGFWRAAIRDEAAFAAPPRWPAVTAIVPARDEAALIGPTVAALVRQAYPGAFRILLVDDCSSDDTAAVALRAGGGRVEVIAGSAPPRGWTGKLWAMEQGRRRAADRADWLWFTDADIVHAPDTLAMLVARAVSERLVLHSLMAELRTTDLPERALVPAFVFFFQMLYPFAAVNRPGPTAAAAGGCMLIDRVALERAGGLQPIAAALIDDCAMGRAMKRQGPIRLSLSHRAASTRPYRTWREVGGMIARSAYAQLGYSPWQLGGTLAGLALLFVVPPMAAVLGHGTARVLGIAAWALMALLFQPMLRFYRRSPLWGVALPAIAGFYAGATVASALAHAQGRGGLWKGRVQARLAP